MGSSDLVFIVGRQRSGTTVFRDLLKRHGAMDCGEIFHGNLNHELRFYRYVLHRMESDPSLVNPERHRALFSDYIDMLRQRANGRKIGLDIKYFALNRIPAREDVDASAPYLVQFMRDRKPSVVHICRANKLRMLVSEQIATKTGQWGVVSAKQLPKDKQAIRVEPDDVLTFLDRQIDLDRRVSKMLDRVPALSRIFYGEMFNEAGQFSDEVVQTASRVMDLEHVDPKPGKIKMNPEPISALVENFEELSAALKGSEHEWMLHDGG